MGPLVWGGVVPLGPLGQGLLEPSGVTVVGQLKQGLVSIAPVRRGNLISSRSYFSQMP